MSLGAQTPLWDLVLAAGALRSNLVALSFSGCMNPNQVADGLADLRAKLFSLANEPRFASVPPARIVPILADDRRLGGDDSDDSE